MLNNTGGQITYRELHAIIGTMSSDQLDMNVTMKVEDEFYLATIDDTETEEERDVLGDEYPYFRII